MPQVDLESLVTVYAGGSGGATDRKIACETLACGNPPPDHSVLPENPPDLPPDSFWLSKDAEFDWFDRNAFYDRNDSTKATTSENLNPHPNRSNSKNSHGFSISLKSKASIIGLPKPQKVCFSDLNLRHNHHHHHKQTNNSLFPKRSAPEGKPRVPVTEPSSPKVSCMGRVRSKKDQTCRCKNRHRGSEPDRKKEKTGGERKPGFWTSLIDLFRSGCKTIPAAHPPRNDTMAVRESPKSSSSPRRSVESLSVYSEESSRAHEPPGLGGMKRFTSGRKSELWGPADVDSESEEGRSTASDRDAVWGRRGMGSLKGIDCRRPGEAAGPTSV